MYLNVLFTLNGLKKVTQAMNQCRQVKVAHWSENQTQNVKKDHDHENQLHVYWKVKLITHIY